MRIKTNCTNPPPISHPSNQFSFHIIRETIQSVAFQISFSSWSLLLRQLAASMLLMTRTLSQSTIDSYTLLLKNMASKSSISLRPCPRPHLGSICSSSKMLGTAFSALSRHGYSPRQVCRPSSSRGRPKGVNGFLIYAHPRACINELSLPLIWHMSNIHPRSSLKLESPMIISSNRS